jgi:tetratricopeptide (TPR) repeat protein
VRILSWLALALLGALMVSTPAAAQAERDLKACTEYHKAAAIDACSRLLKLGERLNDPYMVYVYRGVAYSNAGDQRRAIADLTTALSLDPKNARKRNHGALYQRGDAHLKSGDAKAALADFNAALALVPHYADALIGRGDAYYHLGEHGLAIADYSKLIALSPRLALHYDKRSVAHAAAGDYQKAIADLGEAIKLDPGEARRRYEERADLYFRAGNCERAVEEYSEVLKRDPQSAHAYNNRAWCQHLLRHHDRAVADASKAIEIEGGLARHYHTRGAAYRALGEHRKAILDFSKALAIDPRDLDSIIGRGEAYDIMGEHAEAIEDYAKAATLPSQRTDQRSKLADITKRLATLKAQRPANMGRRVALVIGNTAYRWIGTLPNPVKDARDIAEALQGADGFSDVVVGYDLGLKEMREKLQAFGALANGADWAVIYYAGHGIEVMGRNYLVPVDAKLEQPADLEKEAVRLDWVQLQLKPAGKLQLLILDACRNNPLQQRWMDAKGRAIEVRGLMRLDGSEATGQEPFQQPGVNVLVAYAARAGEVALDGDPGGNSPYARALLKHLAVPGLEVGKLFRKVRDDVLSATAKKQQPYEYGSISGEDLFFRYAPQ